MKQEFASIPKLGFGCMRLPQLNPDDATSIDIPQFKEMVDAFMQAGNTYFDTAYVYHDGASETALKEALTSRYPRDAYTIATKCLAWALPTEEAAKACLPTSLERMGIDYVDFYLLHNVGGQRTAKFDEYGMWDYCRQKREEGIIRHLGFSIHDGADTLEQLLNTHPDMDFVQVQANYLDWDDPVTESRRLMEVADAHDVPVVIMEPVRGGRLADLPEEVARILQEANPHLSNVEWAYRFCWNLPNVVTVLSGASTIEQMRENIASYQRNQPFTEAERDALADAVKALRDLQAVPCTNCRYCVKDCPQGVKIPTIMMLLNLEAMTKDHDFVKDLYSWQAAEGKASECIQCGLCESMCPQKIDIINQLEIAVDQYES